VGLISLPAVQVLWDTYMRNNPNLLAIKFGKPPMGQFHTNQLTNNISLLYLKRRIQ
jgi:hypothetical protein